MPYIDNEVTRFENGVNNRNTGDIFNSLATMDPTRFHTYFDDFDYYNAADWVVTEVGIAVQGLNNFNGGRLLIVNAAADANSSFQQKVGESFLFELGKKAFFRAIVNPLDANLSSFVMGLQILDTTPLSVTDGVYFVKNTGATSIDFVCVKDSVPVTVTAIADAVSGADLQLGYYWDGISRIWFSVNGATLGFIDPGVSLPDDQTLTISFGIQNGEAAIKSLGIDYVFAAMER